VRKAIPVIHEIRRKDRALSESEAREILSRAEYGFLATVGADGWPYLVPVNHVLTGDLIYFHSALSGHKLENIANEERVAFSAVASSEVLPEELATLYESAIAFGRASVVDDSDEKRQALELIGRRFCAGLEDKVQEEIRKTGSKTTIVRIRIERITGKAKRQK
jgi:uncharacterized protein